MGSKKDISDTSLYFFALFTEPSEGPKISCSASTSTASNCRFAQIKSSDWHGIPYGYDIYWIAEDVFDKQFKNLTSFLKMVYEGAFNFSGYVSRNV